MGNVYVPGSAEGFELCHPKDQADFESFNAQIDGTPRRETWRVITVGLVHDIQANHLARSDSPWLRSHALIFRREAIQKLGGLLERHGELLPLACDEADLVVFNATRILDSLDEHASTVTRFAVSGRTSDKRACRRIFPGSAVMHS